MSQTVLATQSALQAARQMQSVLRGGIQIQIRQLLAQGKCSPILKRGTAARRLTSGSEAGPRPGDPCSNRSRVLVASRPIRNRSSERILAAGSDTRIQSASSTTGGRASQGIGINIVGPGTFLSAESGADDIGQWFHDVGSWIQANHDDLMKIVGDVGWQTLGILLMGSRLPGAVKVKRRSLRRKVWKTTVGGLRREEESTAQRRLGNGHR